MAGGLNGPSDLDFRKDTGATNELWVVNNTDDKVVKITNPGLPSQTVTVKKDSDNANLHFMHYPTGIAMGAANAWGVCGENDRSDHFMGPSLYSADFNVFGKSYGTGLGSHLDMLHATPFCMGITHVDQNRYWVFNGFYSSLDLYDFHVDHGPGNDDHSDGEIYRYASGEVKRLAGVPSHLVLDGTTLYVADTGNKRVIAMNTASGTKDTKNINIVYGDPYLNMDNLAMFREVHNATITTIVAAGTLDRPSGLAIIGGKLWVTDNKTGKIHVFEKNGTPTAIYETGLVAGSLAGIASAPDGKIYFVDTKGSKVYRLDL